MADDNIQHGIDDNPNGDAAKGAALGGVGGAAVGAAAGAMAGPVGMAIGAVVGGLAGAVGSGAAVAVVDSMDNDDTLTGIGDGTSHDVEDRAADLDADLPGNGLPGIQTGGRTMDGRQDTRGIMEKAGDTLTGDNMDDKTGRRVDGTDAAFTGANGRTAAGHNITAQGEREIRVPVMEEQAEVRKEAREAGEVTLHKETEVETRHISEPVTHTEVEIEKRDLNEDEAYAGSANMTALKDGDTIRVPVIEEQLEVRKVPKVTGEVVVRTRQETHQVEQDVQLRKEHVDVDRSGEVNARDLDALDEERDLNVDLDTTANRNRGSL